MTLTAEPDEAATLEWPGLDSTTEPFPELEPVPPDLEREPDLAPYLHASVSCCVFESVLTKEDLGEALKWRSYS